MWKIISALIFLGVSFSCSHPVKEEMIYLSLKTETLKGDFWRPLSETKVPLIFVVHGGSWSGRDKKDMDAICETLVKKGFAVFNLNYRLAPKNPFPSAVEDFQSAVLFWKKNAARYNIDFSRLGAWGYSAGAQIAVLGALKLEEQVKFKALVSGAGPMNLSLYPEDKHIKTYLNTSFKENPQVFFEASPYFFVSNKTPPMFFYHSKNDTTVRFRHTKEMIANLASKDVVYELYEVPWFNHFFTFVLSFEALDRGASFLETHVMK